MQLALERLENRLLLAVDVTQKGSTLEVRFDDAGDADVLLAGTAEGAITVTNADTGNDSYTGIKNIKVIGEDGEDVITLQDIQITGNVSIDLKGGDDDVFLEGDTTDIQGSVKAKLGDGDDRFFLSADGTGTGDDGPIHIGKNLTVDLGTSTTEDQFEAFGDTDSGTPADNEVITIGGSVTIKGKAGRQLVQFDSTDIAKNLKVDLGDGDDRIDVAIFAGNVDLAVTVGGNATFKLGDGDDVVAVEPADDGNAIFEKSLTVDLGNAATPGGDSFSAWADSDVDDIIHVQKNFTLKGKGGVQNVSIDFTDVDGNVKIDLGDGDDFLEVSQHSTALLTTIGGKASIKMGAGDDLVTVDDITIIGKVTIDGGAGEDDELNSPNGGITIPVDSKIVNFETETLP